MEKVDTSVEAVDNVVAAETLSSHKMAVKQLKQQLHKL